MFIVDVIIGGTRPYGYAASASLREMIGSSMPSALLSEGDVSPGRYRQRLLGTKGRGLNALVDDGHDVVDHRNEQEQSKSRSNGVMSAFDPECRLATVVSE